MTACLNGWVQKLKTHSFSIIYVYTFDCAVYIVSLLKPGHRCTHIDDLALRPPHAVRGNKNPTAPKFLELRDPSESIFGFFMGHSEIGKPEKCGGGGVGSRIQVSVAVFDDRGVLSMSVELTVARRASHDFRLAPGRRVLEI